MTKSLYIAVEGPIGVGKTTLVSRLAERLSAQVVLEAFEDNPFLTRFYSDRERWAFPTQLFFLMSRFKQQQELQQPDLFRPNLLSDYHLLKDRIFAELTLGQDELMLYERVYRSLEAQILKPDVVIYLHAPLPTLLGRIARRGRDFEKDMDPDYMAGLAAAYRRFFMRYESTPLLEVDNERLDYAADTSEAWAIVQTVANAARRLARQPSPAREELR